MQLKRQAGVPENWSATLFRQPANGLNPESSTKPYSFSGLNEGKKKASKVVRRSSTT
jgi:hypothetical protein